MTCGTLTCDRQIIAKMKHFRIILKFVVNTLAVSFVRLGEIIGFVFFFVTLLHVYSRF